MSVAIVLGAHAVLACAPALAGPCDQGFVLTQGTVAELTSYNVSHQPTGKIVSTIVSSVTQGDTVTAIATVDNYLGATKASTSTVDLFCDGTKVSMNVRNDNAMKDSYGKASANLDAKGQKLLGATNFSEPQIYPLNLKVGDMLPPFRAFAMVVVRKAPPDWGKIAMTGDWFQARRYALDNKFAGGVQMVTMNIRSSVRRPARCSTARRCRVCTSPRRFSRSRSAARWT